MAAVLRAFAGFTLVSGVGWLLDLLTLAVLVNAAGVPTAAANFVSSFVGVTFVWFASLKAVFAAAGSARLLAAYWACQFVSICAFSQLLQWVAVSLEAHTGAGFAGLAALVAKVVITPANLLTNFALMRFLTRFMQGGRDGA